ncbi:MAG: hypothetical protein AB1512_21250 [Thermodesulfobacteriota bacterium]
MTHKTGFPYNFSIFSHTWSESLTPTSSESLASKNENGWNRTMESIELKAREIDNGQFVVEYTKKIVEILRGPELSLEVKAGQISEDVVRLVESLGYRVTAKKAMDDWVQLRAVKLDEA